VLLEQPEIHLHPKVQSALADLFIEVVRSKEGGRQRHVQLIVESHSEHFLRRLQRRVAEEVIRPEEAALYFIEAGPDGASSIRNLELDEYGNIGNWPDGFFGDEVDDIAAMTEAAMTRRLARG
jgi:predicted ATPase